MSAELYLRVRADGRYQAYRLVNGLYKLDVGGSFGTPREAIDFCKAQAPRPRLDDFAGAGTPTSGDDRAETEAPGSASVSTSSASSRCVVCQGPLPPGSRRQRRTCSGACRVEAHRQRLGTLRRQAIAAVQSANKRAETYGLVGRITAEDVLALWERQPECIDCGVGRGVDHVTPMGDGGPNEPSNLQNLCPSSNSRKEATRRLNAGQPADFRRRADADSGVTVSAAPGGSEAGPSIWSFRSPAEPSPAVVLPLVGSRPGVDGSAGAPRGRQGQPGG